MRSKLLTGCLSILLGAAPTQAWASRPGVWTHDFSRDGATGRRSGAAFSESVNGVSAQGDPLGLVVRCRESEPIKVFVFWRASLTTTRPVPVSYRFDKGRETTQPFRPSTDGGATFAPDPLGFVASMARAHRLDVSTFADRTSRRYRASFSLDGFSSAFRNACAWHPEFEASIPR